MQRRPLPTLVTLAWALLAACKPASPPASAPAPQVPDASVAARPEATDAPPPPSALPPVTGAPLSDVMKVRRPAGGETFGLYLMNRKVGFLYTDLAFADTARTKVRSTSEFVFKANVGTRTSERRHREVRIYEAAPEGKLLSFTIDQKGDGGDQVLEGTRTDEGFDVVRRRPGRPPETVKLGPSKELVEDADQARVAILRGASVAGTVTDGSDLESYRVTTRLGKTTTRLIGGAPVKLSEAITLSDKENVPVHIFVDESGRVLEMSFGETMRALAEPPERARSLEHVEVFGLTRVVLPRPAPDDVRSVPGRMTLVMTGLPKRFRRTNYRQSFRELDENTVEVTIKVDLPSPLRRTRPLADPNGGINLKSTIIVEADHPEIRAASAEILDGEKDAYTAARKISDWVHKNLVKDYGASADRATDALKTKRGDCTEHSLLAVALMRAAGIPARRVDGVVYLVNEDKVPALYWHEWVEAYVGEWTQLDPTFGQAVADATHFAVGEEGNAEITPLLGQLKVLELR